MTKFNKRFEVKREMSDGEKIRPDDNSYQSTGGESSLAQQEGIIEEANKVGFEDFNQDDDIVVEEDFDEHKYFVERAVNIDFTNKEENQFMEEYANTIISSFPNISHDEATALLLYITRNEAHRQGVLENIRVRIDNKVKVGVTRFIGIGKEGVISEIVFSEKELIDDINNGNMEAYVTGIGHLVESACHEVEHAKQNSQIYSKNPKLDYETLRMAKESIIARVNPEFYQKNYRSYIMEKKAFLNGRLHAKKTLENLQGVLPNQVYSKIEKRIDELIEFDRIADTTMMKTEKSGYVDTYNADIVLTELTDDIMPMYATDALDKYPILSYQYREDGTKKDLSQLYQERDIKIKQLEEEFSFTNPRRKIEITREIKDIRKFYDEMIEGDRQLIAQKESIEKIPIITNSDVEKELSEYYTEDITVPEIQAYLSEKISQIYGDRLDKIGIEVEKFLDGQELEKFEGVETYKKIIWELESLLACAESLRGEEEIVNDSLESFQKK